MASIPSPDAGLSLDLGPGPAGAGKYDACSDHPQMVCEGMQIRYQNHNAKCEVRNASGGATKNRQS